MRLRPASLRATLLATACAAYLAPPALAAQDYYWETPARLSVSDASYPQTIRSGRRAVLLWQESSAGAEGSEAWISAASYNETGSTVLSRFAGPYPYRTAEKGTAPILFSADVNVDGIIAVASASAENAVTIRYSLDGGLSFVDPVVIELSYAAIAPRIFAAANGGWILFVTHGEENQLSIESSASRDGKNWSPFAPLVKPEDGLTLNFLPSAAGAKGTDVVVFQSLTGTDRPSYQLYTKTSRDGGLTWGAPTLVTTFEDPVAQANRAAANFDNQRPNLLGIGGTIWMTWERKTLASSSRTQVYTARLDPDGGYVPGSAERVTLDQGSCGDPRLFDSGGAPGVAWFDNLRGANHVYFAQREGLLWRITDISPQYAAESAFGRAIAIGEKLWVFWQGYPSGKQAVYALAPDTSTRPVEPVGANFVSGKRVRGDTASIRWAIPADSSGIEGYSYLWSRDPKAIPPERVIANETNVRSEQVANADGSWYFAIRAKDYAGNWSGTSRLEFVRDTTPPEAPVIAAPSAGADGFLASNTTAIAWTPPDDPDVSGYAYVLSFLGRLDRLPARKRQQQASDAAAATPSGPYAFGPAGPYELGLWDAVKGDSYLVPPASTRTAAAGAALRNIDDGYWLLAVSAVDDVGNMGKPARIMLRADKFVPYTLVSDVLSDRDDLGTIAVRILGRGFAEDGTVTRIVVDDDGRAPYYRDYSITDRTFSVDSDVIISGLRLEELEQGSYRIGLFHSGRGWYFTAPVVAVDIAGTIKFGDFAAEYKPSWQFATARKRGVHLYTVFFWLFAAFVATAAGLTLRQVAAVARESESIRLEAIALLEGKPMPENERGRAVAAVKRRGSLLRRRFIVTITTLIILVVLLVSVPLGLQMLDSQSETLARGLQSKAGVLLESITQGAKNYSGDALGLLLLTKQASALEEARYVTITGYAAAGSVNPDIAWATSDPDIQSKVDGAEYASGESVLKDSLSAKIPGIVGDLNKRAAEEVGAISQSIAKERELANGLALKTDAQSRALLEKAAANVTALNGTLQDRLRGIADKAVTSEPAFDPANLGRNDRTFVFYKPILRTPPKDLPDSYYQGLVRLSVSTELINKEVMAARIALIRSVGIVAAIAVIMGIVGAFALSSIIIKPIRALVAGVERIRDTYKKENLEGFDLPVGSKDEIAELAATIVDMTRGLVKGAYDNLEMTTAEQDQRALLPLVTDEHHRRFTLGHVDESTIEFSGYYKGAKLLSGDYLDFRKLDDRHYAFIKCDISGKGVSAAMIMAVVASVFRDFFVGWSLEKKGIKLHELCYRVNDVLIECDFKGKFAAFMVGILDAREGALYLSHAGDKFYRVYERGGRKLVRYELPTAPATGRIDSEMIRSSSPYAVTKTQLARGDILVLFTDGIDEARRYWRDPKGEKILKKSGAAPGARPGDSVIEYESEDFGEKRAADIVEAVLSRGSFDLVRESNPIPGEILTFDFSSCEGTQEEVVLAIVAVEKVFRMWPDPAALARDQVKVDAKVDEFLVTHFRQYWDYCGRKAENPEERMNEKEKADNPNPPAPMYLMYTNVREDEQYDDIAVVTIRRK